MAYNINTTPVTILNSSSTGAGEWYRVHPKHSNLTFQVVHTGTSVAATVASTTVIEASNDGVNALSTPLATIVISGDSPQSLGVAIDANWQWVRAKYNGIQASTAGAAGSGFAVKTIVSSQIRS